jgi:hypothetical protein
VRTQNLTCPLLKKNWWLNLNSTVQRLSGVLVRRTSLTWQRILIY